MFHLLPLFFFHPGAARGSSMEQGGPYHDMPNCTSKPILELNSEAIHKILDQSTKKENNVFVELTGPPGTWCSSCS